MIKLEIPQRAGLSHVVLLKAASGEKPRVHSSRVSAPSFQRPHLSVYQHTQLLTLSNLKKKIYIRDTATSRLETNGGAGVVGVSEAAVCVLYGALVRIPAAPLLTQLPANVLRKVAEADMFGFLLPT